MDSLYVQIYIFIENNIILLSFFLVSLIFRRVSVSSMHWFSSFYSYYTPISVYLYYIVGGESISGLKHQFCQRKFGFPRKVPSPPVEILTESFHTDWLISVIPAYLAHRPLNHPSILSFCSSCVCVYPLVHRSSWREIVRVRTLSR